LLSPTPQSPCNILLSAYPAPWKSDGATLFLKAGEEARGTTAVSSLVRVGDCLTDAWPNVDGGSGNAVGLPELTIDLCF